MNLVRIGILVVALAIAGVVAFLVSDFLEIQGDQQVDIVPQVPTARVLVAAKDLPAGRILLAGELEGDLRWQEWPEPAIAKNWIVIREGSEDSQAKERIAGAMVKRGFVTGEPIVEARLIEQGTGAFLPASLTPGMRAVTIAVSAISGAAGFILPGSKVDVLLTHRVSGNKTDIENAGNQYISESVLENVRVLAIDQNVDDVTGNSMSGKTATLEVSPKEVEKIEVARSMGKLSLVLRSLNEPPDNERKPRGPYTVQTEVSRYLNREGSVLVARTALVAGSLLTDTDMEWRAPPPGLPTEDLLVKGQVAELRLRGALINRDMEPGQPFRSADIIPPGSQGFLTAALGPGLRAISVAVTNVSGVSGFISPGDRVDLILTHQIDDKGEDPPLNPRKFSETILRDVRVLAIEQRVDPTTGKPVIGNTATLEVTPKQSEMIFVAVTIGDLSLTLKGRRAGPTQARQRPFTSDLEVSRATWEFIRGLNRYGPGTPPQPPSNTEITSAAVAEKPVPVPTRPAPVQDPRVTEAPMPRPIPAVRSRSIVRVYRSVGVTAVPVTR